MRVAIIGNSHTGSLIYAMKTDPDILGREIEVTIFAAVNKALRFLKFRGDAIVATRDGLRRLIQATSGGIAQVDVTDYDAFFLMGIGFILRPLDGGWSTAVRETALDRMIGQTEMWRIATGLRERTTRPILCGHNPLPIRRPLRDGSEPIAYDEMAAWFTSKFEAANLTLVRQPAETRTVKLTTRPAFGKGSKRMVDDEEYGKADRLHMNADYGAIYLRALRPLLVPGTA